MMAVSSSDLRTLAVSENCPIKAVVFIFATHFIYHLSPNNNNPIKVKTPNDQKPRELFVGCTDTGGGLLIFGAGGGSCCGGGASTDVTGCATVVCVSVLVAAAESGKG